MKLTLQDLAKVKMQGIKSIDKRKGKQNKGKGVEWEGKWKIDKS